MPKYLLILSLLLCLTTGCERGTEDDVTEQMPVAFTACTDGEEATRAGVITNGNLASMGVFASYTGQGNWSASSSKPDFMYNQPVNKSGGSWTYSPVKYWPNTVGDKISFFAYAPHTDKVSGLTVATGNTTVGYPKLNYTVPAAAASQTDLLAAVPKLNLTKGDNVAFRMGHALTHVLFRLKTTSDVTVTRLEVKGGKSQGQLAFHTSDYTWTSFSGTTAFTGATGGVPVTANTTTEIAGFFLLPSNAASLELTFSESGTTQVETVDLPATPLWEMNKTVAYTLNIDNKTQITLDVKSWDSSSVDGTMGEEVTVPSTGYPFMKNGIIYESATKSYYVSPVCYYDVTGDGWGQESGNTGGWYQWDPAIRICRGFYSFGSYGEAQWRLPNIDELTNIVKFGLNGSSLWSITDAGSGKAWKYRGDIKETAAYTNGHRLLCIRDMGDLTYPTVRTTSDGFPVIYLSATQRFMKQQEWNETGFITFDAAKTYCSGLEKGGYSDWRLPTENELTWMTNFGYISSTFMSSSGRAVVGGFKGVERWNAAGSTATGRVACVRDY